MVNKAAVYLSTSFSLQLLRCTVASADFDLQTDLAAREMFKNSSSHASHYVGLKEATGKDS